MSETNGEARLYIWRQGLSAIPGDYKLPPDIIAQYPKIYGLTYTPRACRFIRIDKDGTARDSDGQGVQLSHCHDMRLFCDHWEMRWRRDGLGARLTILSDAPLLKHHFIPGAAQEELLSYESVLPNPNQYLLWGQMAAARNDWTRLTTARIGAIAVPYGLTRPNDNAIVLTAREYFKQGEDGNWAFYAERLTGFKGLSVKAKTKDKQDQAA